MFDVSILGAGFAGLLSFLSPCILPIVPFYLSYMAGVGMNQLEQDTEITPAIRTRAVLSALAFSAGVITIFVAMGAGASAFGQVLGQYMDVLRWVAAALIATMGLHFLGVIRIGFLYRQFRMEAGSTTNMSFLGAYLIGLAFAFGWTPCVGPVLAAILFTVATEGTGMTRGMLLLTVYGVGMTLPFVLAALFIGPFLRWMRGFRRHLGRIEKATGVFLVLFAVLIGTNSMNIIANWMLNYLPALG
ncbi:cytochrome c biogenesis protein [Dinoroseobacter shibae DFL 12 = DSM 16493]|jgi:cytochrome c-type biogenesis protein|uniref:Cytochrome c biogenesis protein n=1 Tax=Dinoroseobacter shibae (strain DSM 16493 / NCIMB 14021 / DFL 12) TaxID=398580 RepID=A8LJ47_DINSH|nr:MULTISPECIES: cytochrome c biogenesis protein CcdA [Dinoroseobacter]ABV94542.1 cytochrome c biogenesis protein [Dinoroseobacter shibae DFL 12 = DSM 16493]MDD9717016.1 cytochrome c biogenesis protein CcdA [Dinoroseobacter sp. PD6]URF45969.1 cytochrome C biogenesis protein CcdA [Dinoroseobacter shibae]URF50275.1 cytochrome C biogenesis protein CcdA [Dinoroseobacter shibae]